MCSPTVTRIRPFRPAALLTLAPAPSGLVPSPQDPNPGTNQGNYHEPNEWW
jgi:hypothetical protein